jgi:hypothetical protein
VFTPTDLTNIRIWLDASDTGTIAETLGAVSQWDDKSGNSNHAVQSTAGNQPTTGAATQNGLNVLTVDGNDKMDITTLSVTGSQNRSLLCIMDSAGGPFFSHGNSSAGGKWVFTTDAGDVRLEVGFGAYVTNLAVGGQHQVVGCILDGTQLQDNVLVVDGVTETAIGANNINTSANTFYIFAKEIGSSPFANPGGEFAEFVFGTAAWSASEQNNYGNYANGKWATSWSDI